MESRLIRALQRWLGPLGEDLPAVYLVGGAVRDHLLQVEPKDIDLMCLEPEVLAHRLEALHRIALVPFLKKLDAPCIRAVNREDPADYIDLVPIYGREVTADLRNRDFTINAMAFQVLPGGVLGKLLDPLGGLPDLQQRVIRAASRQSLIRDPLRVIRAVRFSAGLGFQIDASTTELMRSAAGFLADMAAERITRELVLILQNPAGAFFIHMLDDVGALEVIFPEIMPMKGCLQSAHHHLDVWRHSLAALEALERLLGMLKENFGLAADAVAENLADNNRLAVLKLAALLHDAGKPCVRATDSADGRITFYGHDAAGAAMAEAIALRLKLSTRDRECLMALVGHHMHVLDLSEPQVRPKTVLGWFRRLGEDMVPSILLSMADTMATLGPASSALESERHLRWGRAAVRSYYTEIKTRLGHKPLISGHDLLALGLAPGPEMGRILRAIREAQDEGLVKTPEEALALAAKLNA
jgi:poly(A) polymerase